MKSQSSADLYGGKMQSGNTAGTVDASSEEKTARSFPLPEPDYTSKRALDFNAFETALAEFTSQRAGELEEMLRGKTILEIQQLLDGGQLSSEELVTYYVDRIKRYDVDKLNAVMELNPQALDIARGLDAERTESGARGPMHGIPVLLKDNIATGDGMHNTAGAYALRNWQPDRDAFQTQQLRAAGAVILGKGNLSEWANYMDKRMPNGFSTLGGQTRHPYGPFDPLGSSSGPAVAVAANLSTVAVGSETQGSIISPSRANGVVGIKTSRGLVSRDYVIPLVDWHDVTGPMGRSVTDVAVLLSAMTGIDENDPDSQEAAELAGTDFTQYLSLEQAQQLRVGVAASTDEQFQLALEQAITAQEQTLGRDLRDDEKQVLEEKSGLPAERAQPIMDVLQAQGMDAVVIDPSEVSGFETAVRSVLEYGFQDSINRFMDSLGDKAPVSSLADVVRINNEDLPNRAPYGQRHVTGSVDTDITAEEYKAMVKEQWEGAAEFLRGILVKYDIDVLITSKTQEYCAAGFPALSVPAGLLPDGQPTNIVLSGDYLSEPKLIAVGYAYEQATQARQEPDLESTIKSIEAVTGGGQ